MNFTAYMKALFTMLAIGCGLSLCGMVFKPWHVMPAGIGVIGLYFVFLRNGRGERREGE